MNLLPAHAVTDLFHFLKSIADDIHRIADSLETMALAVSDMDVQIIDTLGRK